MTSSWQEFVDTLLLEKNKCFQAFIAGADDGTVWANSLDFMPRMYKDDIKHEDGSEQEEHVNEAVNLVEIMKNGGRKGRQGLRINGDKFTIVRSFADTTVYAKKGANGGLCATKTGCCIIVGTYNSDNSGQTASSCNAAVESLGEYLRSQGF